MKDSEKLRMLADWIDVKYPDDADPEVQKDLRRIASRITDLLAEVVRLRAENGDLQRAVYFSSALIKGFAYADYSMSNERTAKAVGTQLKWNRRIAAELEGDDGSK